MQTQKQGCLQTTKLFWGNALVEHSEEGYECSWEAALRIKVRKNKAWSLGVGDGDKARSQKMGLGRVASKPHVGGWRVKNAHRCQMNQVCVKQGDAEKGAQIKK